MTTLLPAVDGFGLEAMVRPDAHVPPAQQLVVQQAVVQQGVPVQQLLVGQQIGWTSARAVAVPTGTGQHGTMRGEACWLTEHTIIDRPAAWPVIPSVSARPTTTSDENVRIERRIARTRSRELTTL